MFPKPRVIEFFAGSGLVRQGLGLWFDTVWANDISQKKADVYQANFGAGALCTTPIEKVDGTSVPAADLSWASFPCQDLSLAGNLKGIDRGLRSGLFWEWLRVLDEMEPGSRPPVLALENVVGWLISNGGTNFSEAYHALRCRGYKCGALMVDAVHFLPQSRPRAFLVAVDDGIDLKGLTLAEPDTVFHPKSVMTAHEATGDLDWVWWNLPQPPRRNTSFGDFCELDAPRDEPEATQYLLSLLSPANKKKVESAISSNRRIVGTGYRRTRRTTTGQKIQRLEVRFDGVAGCLRTPEGGSSRQDVLIVEAGTVSTRKMTVRETARLMGAPDDYKLPGTTNDGYRAMGDAVCAPVAAWLAENLLSPLSLRAASKSNLAA